MCVHRAVIASCVCLRARDSMNWRYTFEEDNPKKRKDKKERGQLEELMEDAACRFVGGRDNTPTSSED